MVHLTRLAAFTAGLVLATASHIVSAMPLDDQVYPDLDGRTTLPLNETLEARQRNLRPRQTAVVPASPAGATLIQLQPCSGISATIPAFVNSKWAQVGQVSDATSVYISQHGAGADFDRYFSAVYNVVSNTAAVIAPAFYEEDDASAPSTWKLPTTMIWSGTTPLATSGGYPSVSPAGCAAFSAYDNIIAQIKDKRRFPRLKYIYWAGHSGGGNTIQRWATFGSEPSGYITSYIIANTATSAYFSTARPVAQANCSGQTAWPYQVDGTGRPPYINSKFTSARALFTQFAGRRVTHMYGTLDTMANYPGGIDQCEVLAQGGTDRRNRDAAFWVFMNLKAGTSTVVSSFYGWTRLSKIVTAYSNRPALNHRICVVQGAGHVVEQMFSSDCAKTAFVRTS